jgi:hypothetical protein
LRDITRPFPAAINHLLSRWHLRRRQKKKAKEQQQRQPGTDSITVKTKRETVVVTVQQMNEPAAFQHKKIHGVDRTGVGVQLTFTVTDGKGQPLQGASATEKVGSIEGETIIQNPQPVEFDSQGRASDYVTNSAPDPTNRAEAKALYDRVTSPFTSKQEFTLTITLKSGAVVQVTQIRTLTNMTNGQLNPVDPKLGTPAYTYKMEKMTARVIKR